MIGAQSRILADFVYVAVDFLLQIFATVKLKFIACVQQQPADTAVGIEQGAKYNIGINDNLHRWVIFRTWRRFVSTSCD
jgi:hypothetical protein